ncbi:MAG: S49 family peptidase [Caldilinea sp.]|nr:S49 family peptidase [Caldilinea sp.]MDW8441987.1 S49 family peptidase [Caldilineaceae bacterium]
MPVRKIAAFYRRRQALRPSSEKAYEAMADEATKQEATKREDRRIRGWEIALALVVLTVCLLGGLALAERQSSGPVIGVLQFSAPINFTTADQLVRLIEAAQRDPSVAGVVLEISSPGGYATSSETAYYTLLNFREHKPLVVVVNGLAASGGYYMAAAGNRIYASPSSYVGNVGTRGSRPTDPTLAPDEMTSGPYKLEGGSRFEQIRQLDLVRNAFLNNVVTQRTHAEVNPLKISAAEIAEARIYLGSEALALGLIDGEGSRIEGIEAVADLAGLKRYRVVDLPTYLNLEPVATSGDLFGAAQSLLAEAPAGAVLMLDSRIPFPENAPTQGWKHLRKPRAGLDAIWTDATSRTDGAAP